MCKELGRLQVENGEMPGKLLGPGRKAAHTELAASTRITLLWARIN